MKYENDWERAPYFLKIECTMKGHLLVVSWNCFVNKCHDISIKTDELNDSLHHFAHFWNAETKPCFNCTTCAILFSILYYIIYYLVLLCDNKLWIEQTVMEIVNMQYKIVCHILFNLFFYSNMKFQEEKNSHASLIHAEVTNSWCYWTSFNYISWSHHVLRITVQYVSFSIYFVGIYTLSCDMFKY